MPLGATSSMAFNTYVRRLMDKGHDALTAKGIAKCFGVAGDAAEDCSKSTHSAAFVKAASIQAEKNKWNKWFHHKER